MPAPPIVKERKLNWCACCDFGRLEGDFSPSEVSTFYPNDYYTHSVGSSESGSTAIIVRQIAKLISRGP